jgi:ABC-2 type transport system ATP-binding protein
MQQRLKLAAALVHDPELLMLDEPTNGLDPQGREEMLTLLRELATEHRKHILLSSHLLPDVEHVCSNVFMLRQGRIVQQGPITELTSGEKGAYEVKARGEIARLVAELKALGIESEGASGDGTLLVRAPDTATIFRAAKAAGTQVRGLKSVRRTLENVFLDAVDAGSPAVEVRRAD